MSYSVYILQSLKNGKYYVGSTNGIGQRLLRHNGGKVMSTKNGRPWKCVYIEIFSTKSEASKREFQIKSWKKRLAVEKLINKNGPIV
ncbi:MAG TPA: GIY-YIG nuclease family protein [Candidatus Paceibacterota bacterium]|nr:GIY-YIG nuclease family protein [Candidatus Paceibacterota bacterium]